MGAPGKQATKKEEIHYEFMGPIGSAFIMSTLPPFVLTLVVVCNSTACPTWDLNAVANQLSALASWNIVSLEALAVCLAWFLLQVILHAVLPKCSTLGVSIPVSTGTTTSLSYRCNGFWCMVVTTYVVLLVHINIRSVSWLYDNFLQLAVAAIIWSWLLSVWLYVKSFGPNRHLAEGGDTGNAVYDFFIGRELNPRTGWFDWKFFCELRPGLMGWVVLNFGFLAKQYELNGQVSPAMIMVCAFQLYYVVDALWNETAILTTMDITTDGFGFMLVFGDLVWVPFIYSLQCRYLVDHDGAMSTWALGAIFVLHTAGLIIFRGANSQKDRFRRNPSSYPSSSFIQTDRPTKLLATGWWGMARHINYLGDWLMGLSWCLPCGFATPIPYFYAVYFAILLIHRERRDDHKCAKKYKDAWKRYCDRVPSRIIPYVY